MFILDSDFICSFLLEEQSTHLKAQGLMEKMKTANLYILNITLQEVATMASRKISQETAVMIYHETLNLKPLLSYLTPEDEEQIWKLFKSYTKKNISFIDCANLYFAKKEAYQIATFDTFYPDEFVVKV